MRRHHCNLYFLIVVWLLSCVSPLIGQVQPLQRQINQTQWQKLTKDPAFHYRNEHEVVPVASTKDNPFVRFLGLILKFLLSSAGRFVIWGIAIGIIAFAIYKVYKSGYITFGRTPKDVTTEDTQEDISTVNWEHLLAEAKSNADLRLAVRYSYMWLLQLLEKRGQIQYRIDKTNFDYYLEMANSKHRQAFKNIARQYEYAWYGNLPVSAIDFSAYMNIFENVKKQL